MKPLTEKQNLILAFIEDHLEQHSYPPTIREVADKFGISIKGGYDHLKALEKKGVLKLGVNRSRAIEVVRRERERVEVDMSEVPVLGSVAAGKPIFADENFEGSVRVPYEMTRNRPCFALRVRGDSMRDAGILDGDIAVIEERPVAADGEIVVAMIDDSVTLKRYFRETGRIRLAAENPAFAPIYTQDARILGRLRGVLRVY